MNKMVIILAILTTAANLVTSHKVLVFSPQLGHSHVSFMGHIADTLAEAGHDVTMFVPGLNDNVTTTGVKLANVMRRPRNFKTTFMEHNAFEGIWEQKGESFSAIYKNFMGFREALMNFCESLVGDHQLLSSIREADYDLIIAVAFNPCTYGFLELVKARSFIIAFPSNFIETFDRSVGVDSVPSYVPATFSPFSDEMDYLERAKNLVTYVGLRVIMKLFLSGRLGTIFSEALGRPFDYFETGKKSAFVFVNSEDFTEFSRPINHKFVYVGGIGVTQPKPLEKRIQQIMESAEKGVVLVSFGSFAKSSLMPDWMKKAFIEAFAELPQINFIWKYETDDDWGKGVNNLFKLKWTPQMDLLGHPRMLAFVTHGGMNSVTESTHAGVPMVCIPLFGDQMRNARMVEKRNVAYILDKQNITKQSIVDALNAVIYSSSYLEASQRLAEMIRHKPISVKERVVRFSEFAAQFGRFTNLNPAMTELGFIQYYLLDIIIPFAVVFFFALFLSIRVFVALSRYVCYRLVKRKIE